MGRGAAGGGVIAAADPAWLVRKLPARILGSAVGSIILVTNAKTIVDAAAWRRPPPSSRTPRSV